MGGGFLVVVVWAAVWVWAGRGLLLTEGRVADRRALVCGVVGLSGAWCRKHACRASASCLCGEWGVVGALAWCGGGMLSGFWGSAPWLPGSSGAPGCGGSWVGVGGLVVNCIVDASILL